MTLANPCVLYQPKGESAGRASTFPIRTGLGERVRGCLPFPWGSFESQLWIFSLSVLLERIKLDHRRDFPEQEGSEAGSLSQILQSLP